MTHQRCIQHTASLSHTHSIQIIQIAIQISMWNNSWTSNRWQRKIDRYHTNRNSSRLPVNNQACQPLCNMYSVIMCCRNNVSMSLISCCRCRSYTRQSGNEQYRNTRRNDYRPDNIQRSLLWVISHTTTYTTSIMNKKKLIWTLPNQRPLTHTQPIKPNSLKIK